MKRNLYLFLLLIICAISNTYTYANNAAGGELFCEWISDSTYRFYVKYYRLCDANSEPATIPLCLQDPCNTSTITTVMTKLSGPTKQSTGCAAYKTTCDSPASNIPGFTTTVYTASVTLTTRCNQWRAFTTIGGRSITNNIQNAQTTPMYLEYKFNNTGNYQGNSSPYFVIPPFSIATLNTVTNYSNGAIDPNGDSLITQVIYPQTAAAGCSSTPGNAGFISTSPAFNILNNPFQTNYTFSINYITGQMTFVPITTGLNTVAVKVSEYRNGVLIGTIIRESIVNVQSNPVTPPSVYFYKDCNTSVPPVLNGLNSGTIYGCTGQQLSFCFYIKNTDTNNVYYLSDNHTLTIPNASITYSNQGNDSVRATFTWIPTQNDAGIKNLIFTVKDSTCRPYRASQYFTYSASIYIWPATVTSSDTGICAGELAPLNVTGAGNYTWTILAGGSSGSLSCNNCTNPIATPTITTRYMVESAASAICPNNKDTVQVIVYPAQPPTVATGDTTICLGETTPLSATGAGNYKWNVLNGTTGSLSCDQCPNPWVTPYTNTTYVVKSSNSYCANSTDTVIVSVVQKAPSYPTVSASSSFLNYAIKNYPITFTAVAKSCDSPAYQWVLNGTDVPGANTATWNTALNTPNAAVYCKMTCADRCAINKIQYSNTIHLIVANKVDEIKNQRNIQIYPNPSTGDITINLNNAPSQTYRLEILNTIGQSVYLDKNFHLDINTPKQISLQQLPTGVYTLMLNGIPYKIALN